MQGITDPETFELSQIVQKSSKSGIFTNKRLLMIKDGFLYYFSKVPSDYKAHEPNLMASLKQYPKCSIEIRSIQSIKLESAKSSTLIITFYDRDMIDREDIRKSLSSKNYNHPVKPKSSDEPEEWKFIFTTVMKCREWYGDLVKLKQYFVKNQDKFDKFAEYMANFDPNIRSSLPQFSPSNRSSSGINSAPIITSPQKMPNQNSLIIEPTKYKMEKQSGIFQIQESIEEYDEQIPQKPLQKRRITEPKIIEMNKTFDNYAPQALPINLQPPSITISEPKKEESKIKQTQDNEIQLFESVIEPALSGKNISETKINSPKPQQKIKEEQNNLKISLQQPETPKKTQKQRQIEQIIQQRQIKQSKEKVELFQRQLQEKEQQIRKMAQQIESNKKIQRQLQQEVRLERERRQEEENLRILLERERKQEEEYKRLQESVKFELGSESQSKQILKEVVLRQESIQTEFQRDIIEVIEGNFKNESRNSRNSFRSQVLLNHHQHQRETLNLFRNTISYISEVRVQQTADIQSYNLFWEMGQIYKGDVKQRVTKELALAEFIRKASRKAADLVTHYIDLNRPKESLKIDRNIFEIEIVCERGKVIRTEGSQRLIYPNDNHQRLKRAFKIYNTINELILATLKKKPNFPLRVPFACLIEYKGYSALARIIPPLKNFTNHSQYLRTFSSCLPIYNLALNDFQTHGCQYGLIQPTIFFKVTKEDEMSIFHFAGKYQDFLTINRSVNVSINSRKLFEESKEVKLYSRQRLQLAERITFCRQLKRIMKANTPYLEDNIEFQFFEDFLKAPHIFMENLIDVSMQKVTGILLYYIEKLLGIRMKDKFDGFTPDYFAVAVKRGFSLKGLDVWHFAGNFDKYVLQHKLQLAEKSLIYLKQLQEDYSDILLKEISLHLHQKQFQVVLQKLELSEQMMSINDPRRLQILKIKSKCHEAVGNIPIALSCLKQLLQKTEYMLGNNNFAEVYFLIADLLSRQGLIPELIQVYRRIMEENPELRQKVLIDFAQNLLHRDTDPHILLDFLQKEIPNSIQNCHPKISQLFGQLYLKAKNRPKAIGFYIRAFDAILEERGNKNIYQIFHCVMDCCVSMKEKKAMHRQLTTKLSQRGQQQSREWQAVNTYVCKTIGESLTDNERHNLIILIEEHKKYSKTRLLEWGWIENIMKKVGRGEGSSEQRSLLIGSIELDILSEHLILLNNPTYL